MKALLEYLKVLSVPVLSLFFALAYFLSTLSLPGIAVTYPRGIVSVIVFLSLWLIISEVKAILAYRKQGHIATISLEEFKRPIMVQVLLLFYFVAVTYIGFYLCSFIWMVVTSIIIDKRVVWGKIWYNILIGVLFVSCAYLVFRVIFFTPTPKGIWL